MDHATRSIRDAYHNKNLVHILFWAGVLLISISQHQYYGDDNKPLQVIVLHDLFILFPQVLASYYLAYLIVPNFLIKKKYILFVVYFFAGSYIICALSRFLTVKIAEPLIGIPSKKEEDIPEILGNLKKLIYVYFFSNFSIAFVFLFVKMLMDQYKLREHYLMLEKERSGAELQYLKAQLNPHFLFNTLNNIYSLSISGSPATSTSIARMAGILDHILYGSQASEVPLSEEIKVLDNYIELERLRYDDRLHIRFDVDIMEDVRIAPLMLLTLVENAFKHGTSGTIGDLTIEIDIKARPDFFMIRVKNPRCDPSDNEQKASPGIGLQNLRKQLELIYPDRHNLDIRPSVLAFTAELTIHLGNPGKKISYESEMSTGRR